MIKKWGAQELEHFKNPPSSLILFSSRLLLDRMMDGVGNLFIYIFRLLDNHNIADFWVETSGVPFSPPVPPFLKTLPPVLLSLFLWIVGYIHHDGTRFRYSQRRNEMLTYSRFNLERKSAIFCCLFLFRPLLNRNCPSLENDNYWQRKLPTDRCVRFVSSITMSVWLVTVHTSSGSFYIQD